MGDSWRLLTEDDNGEGNFRGLSEVGGSYRVKYPAANAILQPVPPIPTWRRRRKRYMLEDPRSALLPRPKAKAGQGLSRRLDA